MQKPSCVFLNAVGWRDCVMVCWRPNATFKWSMTALFFCPSHRDHDMHLMEFADLKHTNFCQLCLHLVTVGTFLMQMEHTCSRSFTQLIFLTVTKWVCQKLHQVHQSMHDSTSWWVWQNFMSLICVSLLFYLFCFAQSIARTLHNDFNCCHTRLVAAQFQPLDHVRGVCTSCSPFDSKNNFRPCLDYFPVNSSLFKLSFSSVIASASSCLPSMWVNSEHPFGPSVAKIL